MSTREPLEQICVRFTHDDMRVWRLVAHQLGCSVAEVIRRAAWAGFPNIDSSRQTSIDRSVQSKIKEK